MLTVYIQYMLHNRLVSQSYQHYCETNTFSIILYNYNSVHMQLVDVYICYSLILCVYVHALICHTADSTAASEHFLLL
jgi:hypothetical protein